MKSLVLGMMNTAQLEDLKTRNIESWQRESDSISNRCIHCGGPIVDENEFAVRMCCLVCLEMIRAAIGFDRRIKQQENLEKEKEDYEY